MSWLLHGLFFVQIIIGIVATTKSADERFDKALKKCRESEYWTHTPKEPFDEAELKWLEKCKRFKNHVQFTQDLLLGNMYKQSRRSGGPDGGDENGTSTEMSDFIPMQVLFKRLLEKFVIPFGMTVENVEPGLKPPSPAVTSNWLMTTIQMLNIPLKIMGLAIDNYPEPGAKLPDSFSWQNLVSKTMEIVPELMRNPIVTYAVTKIHQEFDPRRMLGNVLADGFDKGLLRYFFQKSGWRDILERTTSPPEK